MDSTDWVGPLLWRPGEHVAVVGDTGTGKTFLISQLVKLRRYVVVLRTKPDGIRFPGFEHSKRADAMQRLYADRIMLDPPYERHAREAWLMLAQVWKHGSWTAVVDELWYAEHKLGLKDDIEKLLTQGRSKQITMIVGMQRPAQVSRFAISQCTHFFSFRTEGRDTKTIAEATTPRMIVEIGNLEGHDFAYYNRARRLVTTGNARQLARILTSDSPAK